MSTDTFHFAVKTVLVVLVVTAQLTAPVSAAANNSSSDGSSDSDTIVNVSIDVSGIINAVKNLTGKFASFKDGWTDQVKKVLLAALFHPFRTLLQQLLNMTALVLTNTPSVYPNPPVEKLHQQTLIVAYLLAGLAVVATGILYIVGPVFGVSYAEVKMVLPRILAALAFSTVSLQLLQLSIDVTDALVFAFRPTDLTSSLARMTGVSVTVVLVWVINAWLLLAVVVMFLVRGVYLLFAASISPLIALGWAFPKSRKYANTFIAGWWTALAMAPLDLLAFRLTLELMKGHGAEPLQSLSNWIFGIAGFVLMLWIPYELHGAAQSSAAAGYGVARSVRNRVQKTVRERRGEKGDGEQLDGTDEESDRSYRRRRDR